MSAMQTTKTAHEEFWQRYKQSRPEENASDYSHYYFCDNEEDAVKLADLVLVGKKRATASLVAAFEDEGQPLPKPGDCCIVTDFHGHPLCIVKTTAVDIVAFRDVTQEFASIEGEGDGSLAYWQRAHRHFFSNGCKAMGLTFTEDMPIVCEQFELVFKP
jgi:uncharacterized protein YhfF